MNDYIPAGLVVGAIVLIILAFFAWSLVAGCKGRQQAEAA
jgi:hypothetical protein